MVFQNDIIAGASGAGSGYTIDQSIRFNDDDSAYMSATLGTATDTDVYTISLWVKRGNLGLLNYIFSSGPVSTTTEDFIGFQSDDTIFVRWAGTTRLATTQVFRDPSAWYHVVLACDYAASGSDKAKLYLNGAEVTAFTTDTRSSITGTNQRWNTSTLHYFGRNAPAGGQYLDGYLSEINFIDGQQLAPTDFGEYNNDGVWVPKAYAGTYGTNGFYITGADSADLGADESGNSNDFTSSGLTSDDQVTDTPTENYATLNPLDDATGFTTPLISNGNLDVDDRTGNAVRGNFGFKQGDGKYVYEVNITNLIGSMDLGWSAAGVDLWAVDGAEVMYEDDGNKLVSANSSSTPTQTSYGDSYTSGDVIRVETDFTASTVEFFKNGTSQGSIDFSGMNDGTLYFPACYCNRVDAEFNFGQQPFIGTPTAEFVALSTANLPEPTIADGSAHFQTTLYTGNGTAIGSGGNAVTQIGNSTFQPDFVWMKSRSAVTDHALYDAVRGATKEVISNSTAIESTLTEGLTTFGAAGFTVGSDAAVNTNTAAYAAWQWLAGNGTASNSDGDITSTVSVNTTAGFSIVSYTGNGSASQTVGHGLGVTPKTVIIKPRSSIDNWLVSNWETGVTAFTEKLKLNDTEAASSSSDQIIGGSSTTFTIGTDSNVNGSGTTYIAYCWNEVEGFSKFGSYTGNGSTDGPFVWCGFKPAFVLVKPTGSTGQWSLFDNKREGYNVDNDVLVPNTTAAETTTDYLDLLSNGFKARTTDADVNASNGTYIYMAFAENPLGGENVVPATAV